MKLLSLTTKNFKKLGSRTLNFTAGLNFIVGENARGKSTVLRAIDVAFHGASAVPGLVEDIPTWGSSTWKVELDFEHRGQLFHVERTKSSSSLTVDGELVASGNTPVTKYLEDLRGLSKDDHFLFVHSRQGDTAYALKFGATALQKKVEKFSGAERIEVMANIARNKRIAEQTIVQSLTPTCDKENFKTIKSALEDAIETKNRAELDLKALEMTELPEEPMEPTEPTTPEINAQRNKYVQYLSDLQVYQNSKKELESQIAELPNEKELGALKGVEELEAELRELREVERSYTAWQAEVVVAEAAVKRREQELEDLNYSVTPEQIAEAKRGLDSASEELEAAKSRAGDLKREIKHLDNLIKSGKCDHCGSVLADAQQMEVNRKTLEDMKAQLAAIYLDGLGDLYSKTLSVWTRLVKEKETYTIAVENLGNAKDDLKQTTSKPLKPVPADKLDRLVKEVSAAELHNEKIEETRMKLTRLQRRLDALEQPIEVPEIAESQVKEVQAIWDDYLERLSNFKEAKQDLAAQITRQEAQVRIATMDFQSKKEAVAHVEDAMKRMETAKGREGNFKELAKYLSDKRADFLTQTWDSIMHVASERLNSMTGGWLTELSVDDGKFKYKENGHWVSTTEASGAQTAFIGIALRSALNRVLYSAHTFSMFDEPTEAMSEANSRRLTAAIGAFSGQTFVVSHKVSDQGLATNVMVI